MLRRPPTSTRTDTLFPYTTLFRSLGGALQEFDDEWQVLGTPVGLAQQRETRIDRPELLHPMAVVWEVPAGTASDRKSTRLNSSHLCASRMPYSACKKKTPQTSRH